MIFGMMHCTAVQIEVDQVITPASHLPEHRRKYLDFVFILLFPNACHLTEDVSDTFVQLVFNCKGQKQSYECWTRVSYKKSVTSKVIL